jgi:hypothetical protein
MTRYSLRFIGKQLVGLPRETENIIEQATVVQMTISFVNMHQYRDAVGNARLLYQYN